MRLSLIHIYWQREAVMEFYGEMVGDEADPAGSYIRRYQYLYLEIAKKNGKSELAAALGVYHLYADGEINGEVYVLSLIHISALTAKSSSSAAAIWRSRSPPTNGWTTARASTRRPARRSSTRAAAGMKQRAAGTLNTSCRGGRAPKSYARARA